MYLKIRRAAAPNSPDRWYRARLQPRSYYW